jgi:hypothetical protein
MEGRWLLSLFKLIGEGDCGCGYRVFEKGSSSSGSNGTLASTFIILWTKSQ